MKNQLNLFIKILKFSSIFIKNVKTFINSYLVFIKSYTILLIYKFCYDLLNVHKQFFSLIEHRVL